MAQKIKIYIPDYDNKVEVTFEAYQDTFDFFWDITIHYVFDLKTLHYISDLTQTQTDAIHEEIEFYMENLDNYD